MSLTTGQPAPEFPALTAHRGSLVFLYFYPKDDTPGCTIEACSIRDNFAQFKKYNCAVLGVSIDTEKSHAKFTQKFTLPFTLVPDDKRELVKLYDVWGEKEFMGRQYMGTLRTSFLIDPDGKIRKIYQEVRPKTHIAEVLKDLKKITAR